MNKDIDRKDRNGIVSNPLNGNAVDIHRPQEKGSPFISFRFSYKKISSRGGLTHITAKEKRFENGEFQSAEFEGTLPGSVHSHLVDDLQKKIFDAISSFLKPLSQLFSSKSKNTPP